MRAVFLFLFLGVTLLGTAAPLSADPVTIVAAQRNITVLATTGPNAIPVITSGLDVLSNSVSSTNAATGESSTALAFQNSTVHPDVFSSRAFVSASAVSRSVNTIAKAAAVYQITFDVAQPTQFDFGGTFNVIGGNANVPSWEAELFTPLVNPTFVFRFFGGETSTASASGILPPGHYGFLGTSSADRLAGLNAVGSMAVDSQFVLTFSEPAPTPEPASLFLLGTGIVAAVSRRWLGRVGGFSKAQRHSA